ncbi:MAG: hypothetical protein J7L73_08620 [Anaerolineales bacterium]|nr:hypothetical protein [Anaerolineales bacterium]
MKECEEIEVVFRRIFLMVALLFLASCNGLANKPRDVPSPEVSTVLDTPIDEVESDVC